MTSPENRTTAIDNNLQILPLVDYVNENGISFEEIILKNTLFLNKEEKIHLLETAFLEENKKERILDRYIEEIVLGLAAPLPPVLPPELPRPAAANPLEDFIHTTSPIFYSETGFRAAVVSYDYSDLKVGGMTIYEEGSECIIVDFTPDRRTNREVVERNGKTVADFEKMTDSLTKGIQGILEMVAAIKLGTFKGAEVVIGHTNLHMAIIAQRLGFTIVDTCRNPDGSVNKSLPIYTVCGKLADVKSRVLAFEDSVAAQRLQERHSRQRGLTPQPAF